MEFCLDPRQRIQSPASMLPADFDINKVRAERERVIERSRIFGQVPISRAFPSLRVLALGSQRFTVEEFRLSDLATIQGWLESRVGDPLADLPPASADPDPTTRRGRLLDLWAKTSGWYPTSSTPEGARHLATLDGQRFFLSLALERHQGNLSDADLDAILAEATPAQWSALIRVLYGITPKVELLSELVPDDEASPLDWPKAIVAVVREYGLTFAQVADLTIGQWRLLCRGGESAERSKEFNDRARRISRARPQPTPSA